MNAQAESTDSRFDLVKWLVVAALIVGAIVANDYFADQPVVLRAAGVIVAVIAALFVALQTGTGRRFWVFSRESRTEWRKVVWPTRQETVQTTIVVLIAVIILALLLWGLDSLLGWLVSQILG